MSAQNLQNFRRRGYRFRGLDSRRLPSGVSRLGLSCPVVEDAGAAAGADAGFTVGTVVSVIFVPPEYEWDDNFPPKFPPDPSSSSYGGYNIGAEDTLLSQLLYPDNAVTVQLVQPVRAGAMAVPFLLTC